MFICATEEKAEALAAFEVDENETVKPPAQQKVEDATDGKFEDFVAAGVRTAELVAAGARAASHVAEAVLNLRRGGDDYREPARGVGLGIGSNASTTGIS